MPSPLTSQTSLSRYASSTSYRTDLSKYSSESLSSEPARPYVSAIRKRRTLFDDLESNSGQNESRPLSIVNEEANYHGLTRSLSAKGDSRNSDNYRSLITSSNGDGTIKSNRVTMKKSASAQYDSNSSGMFDLTIFQIDFIRLMGFKYERRRFLEFCSKNFWSPTYRANLWLCVRLIAEGFLKLIFAILVIVKIKK